MIEISKYINRIIISILIVLSFMGFSRCDEIPPLGFPDSNVNYQNHVMPFMSRTCGFVGCHNEDLPTVSKLTDYFSMNSNPGLIIPNKPDSSLLIQILDAKSPHIPLVYFNINENEKKGMRKWVAEGAKFN